MSIRESLVIGADVGGTNTKMALARFDAEVPVVRALHIYKSGEHDSLESVIDAFLRRADVEPHTAAVTGACFAVAGPVEHGRGRLTNLPWQPDETEIAERFKFGRVRIINDFAAAGRGIAHLGRDDLHTLQAGLPQAGAARVVLGAGTGLGVAMLDWDGARYEVHPSEAGHTDFAPVDGVQVELLEYLRKEFGRVSHERVVCGAGLKRVFDFVEHSGAAVPTAALKAAMATGDAPGAVSEFALSGRDEAAARALEIFVTAYGAFAGNMALTMLAHGGVFLAGGIAPKIIEKLKEGAFMRAFTDKGRFQGVLESMPVHVVMNDHVGLYGALAEAAQPGRAD